MEKQNKIKKLIFYTLYKVNTNNNDIIPIKQFDNLKEIQSYLNIPIKTIYNRLNDKSKILNKYILYKDYI